ncbi:hypothetical protein PVK06_007735 [Gossypium arboreum]|uniref:Uncharacterized protein n=1 Tax=Gossypium arboreum TaxID=29729 RepID=A0ABR0QIZ2_GOSAR|nr:hypothetical protein PVK06_007735 [Gossypium arboreum]
MASRRTVECDAPNDPRIQFVSDKAANGLEDQCGGQILHNIRRVDIKIDLEEPTYPSKGVLNDVLFEQFYNQQASRVDERNEQVAVHREYTRDHELPEPIKKPQLVPPRVHLKKANSTVLMDDDQIIRAYLEYITQGIAFFKTIVSHYVERYDLDHPKATPILFYSRG